MVRKSGWFRQTLRHRLARKGIRTKEFPHLYRLVNNLSYAEILALGINLHPEGDYDKDDVINKEDCKPLNPREQGRFHEWLEKTFIHIDKRKHKLSPEQQKEFEQLKKEYQLHRRRYNKAELKLVMAQTLKYAGLVAIPVSLITPFPQMGYKALYVALYTTPLRMTTIAGWEASVGAGLLGGGGAKTGWVKSRKEKAIMKHERLLAQRRLEQIKRFK